MSAKSRAIVQSMLHSPIILPHLRTLELSWPGQGPNQTAIRRFIKHQLPSIKYHNQHLKVIVHPVSTEGAQTIKFTRDDSTESSFAADEEGLRNTDILARLTGNSQANSQQTTST